MVEGWDELDMEEVMEELRMEEHLKWERFTGRETLNN